MNRKANSLVMNKKEKVIAMNKIKNRNKDALTVRIRKTRKRRIWKRICRILIIVLILVFAVLKFFIGIAHYQGDTLASDISGNSYIVYLKMPKQYSNNDLVVYKDVASDKVFIQKGVDYDKQKNSNTALKTEMLGKIVWHVPIGRDD